MYVHIYIYVCVRNICAQCIALPYNTSEPMAPSPAPRSGLQGTSSLTSPSPSRSACRSSPGAPRRSCVRPAPWPRASGFWSWSSPFPERPGKCGRFWKFLESTWMCICLSIYLSIYLSLSMYVYMYIFRNPQSQEKNGKVNQLSFDLFGITMCMYCMYVWVAGI